MVEKGRQAGPQQGSSKDQAQRPGGRAGELGLSPAVKQTRSYFALALPFSGPNLCSLFFPFTFHYLKELCNFSFSLFATCDPWERKS